MPIDEDAPGGRMFVVTGNGTNTTYPPFSANSELGESVIDVNLSNGGLTPTDAFTSFNYETLNSHDWDQGSGGILMVPDQQGANPHILVTGGKEGCVLVLNRDNLGGYLAGASSNTNALQDITGLTPQGDGFWNTPAYWNGNVYIWPEYGSPTLFELNNGVMNTTPSSQSSITSNFPSPSFSISSNGTQDGIAWAVRSDRYVTYGQAVLYAWPANDLTTPLYESDTNAKRDTVGIATKFSIPVVINGKVYVVAHNEVAVFGLFNGEPNAAAPVITPKGAHLPRARALRFPPRPRPRTSTIRWMVPLQRRHRRSTRARSQGASTTSTITITSSGGFTGSVALTCAVTASPSGTIDSPTCTATPPAAISGTAPVTATLTINTTPASPGTLTARLQRMFTLGGGGTLAALLFFCLPLRRRKWQTLFGLLVLVAVAAAATGCVSSKGTTGLSSTGTTAGSYIVTVTGTSGSAKATTAVAVTVQ